jgi:hypothetical protein
VSRKRKVYHKQRLRTRYSQTQIMISRQNICGYEEGERERGREGERERGREGEREGGREPVD